MVILFGTHTNFLGITIMYNLMLPTHSPCQQMGVNKVFTYKIDAKAVLMGILISIFKLKFNDFVPEPSALGNVLKWREASFSVTY